MPALLIFVPYASTSRYNAIMSCEEYIHIVATALRELVVILPRPGAMPLSCSQSHLEIQRLESLSHQWALRVRDGGVERRKFVWNTSVNFTSWQDIAMIPFHLLKRIAEYNSCTDLYGIPLN
ncbi:hypothetical protein KIN20_000450 [Parelaphostrongylus tenuis]|uniref:Uncharacterized protein n=1 Tax=Parelaphostrongylus tenuis TaxID=148309 RepID=A0AAD5LUR3_PARTN|nr:hypothetical protein KIN20_000450 [Parelaphostrongylus tenuis]